MHPPLDPSLGNIGYMTNSEYLEIKQQHQKNTTQKTKNKFRMEKTEISFTFSHGDKSMLVLLIIIL